MFKLNLISNLFLLFLCNVFFIKASAENFIRSHEAVYSLELMYVSNKSQVHSLNGIMKISLKKVCDGWVFNQHTELDVKDRMGNQNKSEFRYSTWESSDYKKFRFLSISTLDGEETSHVEGYAFIEEDYGRIIFEYPEYSSLLISSETLFPMNHFFLTMKKDYVNNPLSNELVFSGEDENSINLVSTFKKSFPNNNIIMVRSAYFSLSDFSEKPDSEVELMMFQDGLVNSVIFNYINYKLKGNLLEYEYLIEPNCK